MQKMQYKKTYIAILIILSLTLSCSIKFYIEKRDNKHEQIAIIEMGGVNCYLIKTKTGHIMIDTGYPAKCQGVEKCIRNASCDPESLKLIIITHGDHDHAGNSAYLRDKFDAKIAMHIDDIGMVENGDQDYNRKDKADYFAFKFKLMSLMSVFFSTDKFTKYSPDIIIDETFDLSSYGLNAQIIHLPGHSKGSIGLLTNSGELFCGDLIYNFFKPEFLYIDDLKAAKSSIEKLKSKNVKKVYSGHGKPFFFNEFLEKYYNKKHISTE
jgi:glyoxylase-like metal-dependent hydrolase (beta-lactamase superfamily II)